MVVLVLGLLLGGFLGPLSVLQEVNKRQEAGHLLQNIHDSMIGFVITHGYLPCPDFDNDGREDRTPYGCSGRDDQGGAIVGQLPYVTLGLGRLDPWNNRFTYAVDPAFADDKRTPLPNFTSARQGNITVTHGIDHTPAVVVSHGDNGLGAVNSANLPQKPAESTSERENSDNNATFVLDDYRDTPEDSFDDIMVWISPNMLALRMLQAGKPLP
ncbi:MAG: hypothetical protein HW380_1180 [Magnetococcales bacterium]|nr:hypothetical protein [Magnetococcales bacterium]